MTNDADNPNQPDVFYFCYCPAFFGGFEPPQRSRQDQVARRDILQPRVKIWTRHPAEDDLNYAQPTAGVQRSYLTVDLTRTPSKRDLSPEQVEVDDHVNVMSGFTTFGPCFPHAYGAASIYRKYITDADVDIPPDQTAIVRRFSYDNIRRYHGFIGLRLKGYRPPNLWVIYHPGSASRDHGRAPRKLVVPQDHICPQPYPESASKDPTHDVVYLERGYALYEAALDVPKKPSGSGEKVEIRLADPQLGRSGPAAPVLPPSPTPPGRSCNLHIIGAVASGEIGKIAQKLTLGDSHNYLQLQERETLSDGLIRFANANKGRQLAYDNLDLIGHSRSRDNILKLGEYALTSRVITKQCNELADSGILDALGIRSIRLLGCRTACSPRAKHVVEAIRTYFPDKRVWAARADLFAVHYDVWGLQPEAESLLADDNVITLSGPGDLPPGDDYPPDPPGDDDDDDGNYPPPSASPFPFEFVVAALSDPNAATVAARSFLFWDEFEESFDALTKMTHSRMHIRDNELLRADCEVLVAISGTPTTIAEIRSFDIFLKKSPGTDLPPRVRVYAADGTAYAFPFIEKDEDNIRQELARIGIHSPQQLSRGYSWI